MPDWKGSNRRDRLPANWPKLRDDRLRHDKFRCRHVDAYGDETCQEMATDVDHKVPGDDHSFDNLQSLCEWHHQQKSGAEGARARAIARRKINQRFRRTEEHPGLL